MFNNKKAVLDDISKHISLTKDKEGETALHHACKGGKVELVKKLIKLNVDVNAQDNKGWSPVLTVVYYNLQNTIDTYKSYRTQNTVLGVPCTVLNSTSVQLLLSKDAQVDSMNSRRPTQHRIACSHYSDISYVQKIIHLLTSHHCDITAKDKDGKTALHYCVNCEDPSIPLSLIAAGCDITVKDNKGETFSDLAPASLMQKIKKRLLHIERRQIICVIGHSKCGKTTLIAALERNQVPSGWFYRNFWKPYMNAEVVKFRTAGIKPTVINGQSLQHVIFFDFAGQAEYYSSHSAFLESALSVKGTTVTFIMMTDLRCTEEERFEQCMEWLYPIKSILKEHNQLDVLLVGSHLDQLSKWWFWLSTEAISSLGSMFNKLKQLLNCRNMNFVDYWGMDCRKISSAGISKLQQHLQNQRKQRLPDDSTSKVPLAACVLFDKLHKKSLNLCISVDGIVQNLKDDNPPFPLTREFIDPLCRELASSGLALYIPDKLNMGGNLLILNIGEVLTHIHGKLFAPNSSEFPMHNKNLANKFGLVHASELQRAFEKSPLKPDMIEKILIAMEFCHPVDADLLNSEIGQLLGTTEEGLSSTNSRKWLYFPSFVSTDPPKQKLFDEEHSGSCPWMCWELRTVKPHYYTPRFQQALFVRLGAKYVHHNTDDSRGEIIEHSCQVWKNGMSWSHRSGVHICIGIKQKSIVQILACSEPDLKPPKMEPVVNLISDVAREVHIVKEHHSPGVSTTSCLRQVVEGFPSGCSVLVNDLICAVKEKRMHVNKKEDIGLIAIRDFLDDWNPCPSILEKMVLVRMTQDEDTNLEYSSHVALTSSQPQEIPSSNLSTQSGTTSSQSTRKAAQSKVHSEQSGK